FPVARRAKRTRIAASAGTQVAVAQGCRRDAQQQEMHWYPVSAHKWTSVANAAMLICPVMSRPPVQLQAESPAAELALPEVALQAEDDGGAAPTSRRPRRNPRTQASDAQSTTFAYMNMTLDKQGALYEQLARALKKAILEGQFAPGSQMPGTR